MRYFLRSLKYFIYLFVLVAILLGILTLLGQTSADPATMFRNGRKSVMYIAIIFAVVAAIYPKWGYIRRNVNIYGRDSEKTMRVIRAFMEGRGYREEVSGAEHFTYVMTNPLMRFMRTYEDRITFDRIDGADAAEGGSEDGGGEGASLGRRATVYAVEGPTRDVVRLMSGLAAYVSGKGGEGDASGEVA